MILTHLVLLNLLGGASSTVTAPVVIQHGGGGGRKKRKSWDERERERLEQLHKDEEARRLRAIKDKFGDLPKPLVKVLAAPHKRLDPASVKAYQRLRAHDDDEAMAVIARLL